MHAVWNLMVRGHGDKQVMVLRMLMVIGAVGLIPAVVSEWMTRSMTPSMWGLAAVAGTANGLYYVFLARSLTVADFATAFPVIRALPVVLIALGDVALGKMIAPVGWVAVWLVAAGCLLTPQESFRSISHHHYWRISSIWILLAAVAAVGYTLLDGKAMDLINASAGGLDIATGARYQYFHLLFSLAAVTVVGKRLRKASRTNRPAGWRIPAMAAALNFAGYCMILCCYQLVAQRSYVWAMRQFSIIIGVVLAFAIFKERGKLVRLTGAALIMAGLILIGLFVKSQ
jgi:drug/metabolite transporter (DMT)-like permease